MPVVTTYIQGGLGNQMFQIAIALCVGWRDNCEVIFKKIDQTDNSITKRVSYWDSVFHRVKSDENFNLPEYRIHEHHNHIFMDIPRITIDSTLFGFFQTSRYFYGFGERLKSVFSMTEKQQEWVQKLSLDNVVGVHVRRTDYVKLGWTLPSDFYKKCLDMEECKGKKVLVFSDDLDWCKEYFGDKVSYFEGYSDIENFYALSSCGVIVMANSTFSWWAAYLSKAVVIAPKSGWFNDDISEKGWIVV